MKNIKTLIEIEAIKIEVEGFKAENQQALVQGNELCYNELWFQGKAGEIRNLLKVKTNET